MKIEDAQVFMLHSVSVPSIILFRYSCWIIAWYVPLRSGLWASVWSTLREGKTGRCSGYTRLCVLPPGGWDGLEKFVTNSAH